MAAEMTGVESAVKSPERLVSVTVRLTVAELAAVSRAAAVVTSGGEPLFINAAGRALRKLRDTAAKHPDLPESGNRRGS
jgi:hypothetical protein